MTEWWMDRVGSALAGTNPTVMKRLPAAFAVIGDIQFLPGYSVAISDRPAIDRLSDLPRTDRVSFLSSMDTLGEAVERACSALDTDFRRVNLEILGNTDSFLHAHVWPRYEWEEPNLRSKPVWLYPSDRWSDPTYALAPQHDVLRARITAELESLT